MLTYELSMPHLPRAAAYRLARMRHRRVKLQLRELFGPQDTRHPPAAAHQARIAGQDLAPADMQTAPATSSPVHEHATSPAAASLQLIWEKCMAREKQI